MLFSNIVRSLTLASLVLGSVSTASATLSTDLGTTSCRAATWQADLHGTTEIGGLDAGDLADVEVQVPRRGLVTVALTTDDDESEARLRPSPCRAWDTSLAAPRLLQASGRHLIAVAEAGPLTLRVGSGADQPLPEARLTVHFLPFAEPELPSFLEPAADPFRAPCTPGAPTKSNGESDDEGEVDPDGLQLPCFPQDRPWNLGESDDEGEVDPDGLQMPIFPDGPNGPIFELGESDDEGEVDPDGLQLAGPVRL